LQLKRPRRKLHRKQKGNEQLTKQPKHVEQPKKLRLWLDKRQTRKESVLPRKRGSNVNNWLKKGDWLKKKLVKSLWLQYKKREHKKNQRKLPNPLALALHFRCLDWVVPQQ
jgi:hypothetical protein